MGLDWFCSRLIISGFLLALINFLVINLKLIFNILSGIPDWIQLYVGFSSTATADSAAIFSIYSTDGLNEYAIPWVWMVWQERFQFSEPKLSNTLYRIMIFIELIWKFSIYIQIDLLVFLSPMSLLYALATHVSPALYLIAQCLLVNNLQNLFMGCMGNWNIGYEQYYVGFSF